MCKRYFLIHFGSLDLPRTLWPPSFIKSSIFIIFRSLSVCFGGPWGAIGRYFGSPGVAGALILRVWGYPWADLARSSCQRPPPPFSVAPFLTIFEAKWDAKRRHNGATIFKKSVQNSIKKSMRFWMAFLLDFSGLLMPKLR